MTRKTMSKTGTIFQMKCTLAAPHKRFLDGIADLNARSRIHVRNTTERFQTIHPVDMPWRSAFNKMHHSFTEHAQETTMSPRLLPILLLPLINCMYNPPSIKRANRNPNGFPPLTHSNTSFSHSHNPMSILLGIRKEKRVKCPFSSFLAVGNGTSSHCVGFM